MLTHAALLRPLCAQVLLTLIVWCWMYITRIGAIFKSRKPIQDLADESKSDAILKHVVNPSDNFENLFEMPVLFYIAIVVLIATGSTDSWYVSAAWIFVVTRALHSLIHCTTNIILLRFAAYLAGSFVVWAMWARIAMGIR